MRLSQGCTWESCSLFGKKKVLDVVDLDHSAISSLRLQIKPRSMMLTLKISKRDIVKIVGN